MKEKLESLFRCFSHVAKFTGIIDVQSDNEEDSFVLKVDNSKVEVLAGRGAREDD